MRNAFMAAAAILATMGAANATTITGTTSAGDGGGLNLVGGSAVAVPNPGTWTTDPTKFSTVDSSPAEWVWSDDDADFTPADFEMEFDLTPAHLSTTSLFLEFAADNAIDSIELNGQPILAGFMASTGPNQPVSNYSTLNTATYADSGFTAGTNSLLVSVTNDDNPAGFYGAATVTATSVVPLPAGAPLLIGGLAVLVLLRRRHA